jgi:hypothetical protein
VHARAGRGRGADGGVSMSDDAPPHDLDDPDAALLLDPAVRAAVAREEEKQRREACARLAGLMPPDLPAANPAFWLDRLDRRQAPTVLDILDSAPDASEATRLLVIIGALAESAKVARDQLAARQAGAASANAVRREYAKERDDFICEMWTERGPELARQKSDNARYDLMLRWQKKQRRMEKPDDPRWTDGPPWTRSTVQRAVSRDKKNKKDKKWPRH